MPFSLFSLAYESGIKVEYWDFPPPVDALYWYKTGLPPYIGLANRLYNDKRKFRCVLAEELGHHFTSAGKSISHRHTLYSDRLNVSRVEHKALRWAALYLMPQEKVIQALKEGKKEIYELVEHFNVTRELLKIRLKLSDMQELKYIS